MADTDNSCKVAPPRECNYATLDNRNETSSATAMQQPSLIGLSDAVLKRNQQCNRNATSTNSQRNSPKSCRVALDKGRNRATLVQDIRAMAKRWKYPRDDLAWALWDSRAHPDEWAEMCRLDSGPPMKLR